MSTHTDERLYRFSPLDRTGWMLGLQGPQCIALGVGVFVAGVLLNSRAPAPAVLAPLASALVFSFARVGDRTAHEWTPVVVRWGWLRIGKRRRWFAELPLLAGSTETTEGPPLPPFLAGLSILDVGPAPWAVGAAIGVVRDATDRSLSGTLRVSGRGFSLYERSGQERALQGWGDVLGAFCSERSAVRRLRWCEWAAPAGLEEQQRFADNQCPADSAAVASYRELLETAGPLSTRHETLLTLTVDPRRLRRAHNKTADAESQAIDVLVEELRLLTTRLEAAGVDVSPPLSPVALAEVMRLRIDPSAATSMALRSRSLAQLAGVVSRYNAGPLSAQIEWSHLRLDGGFHRTYWCAEWPRLDVGPNWLEPLLLHSGGVRTISMLYEPVAPSRSRRQIERDSTRLASDEEQRSRSGFRIGARHRRAQAAVAEREAEMVAGYAELEYAGFVTVTADNAEDLLRLAGEYEQVAAQAGVELRAVEGRHDQGFLTALPIGRGLAPRRLA